MNLEAVPVLFAALASAGLAHALPGDSGQEINLGADSSAYDRERGVVVYRGNVFIERGGLTIHGDELVLELDGDELAAAIVHGAPARFAQRHGDGAPTEGEARELVYDVAGGEVRLHGGVRITQGGNEIVSEDIRYDVESERVVAAGESDSRIRMTIQPRRRSDADGPPPEPDP